MGVELYPSPPMEAVELVDVLRALSDPTRLRMVQVLADGQAHSKNALDWGLDVQKSTLAHHFKTLREAGVTRTLVEGRRHWIELRRTELDAKFPGLIEALVRQTTA